MITALLWKEYREHRIVWAAMAVLGAGLLLGLPFVMAQAGAESQHEMHESLCGTAVLLTWLYGMVCGAMLLALEREMGTLPFLDALPGYRRQVWQGKCLAGVVLLLAQIAFLMGIGTIGHLFKDGAEAAYTLCGMLGLGFCGFAWGLLFSAYGRTVMYMILLAFAGQVAAFILTGCLAAALEGLIAAFRGGEPPRPDFVLLGLPLLTIPLALAGSMRLFTHLDRSRSRPPARQADPRIAWSVLFWLTWRQARGFALGMVIFGWLLGFFVPAGALGLWPTATLVVGMLCGATAFADEQQGPFRFLGDQRLPLGRLWAVKISVRFLIAVAAAVLVFLPSFLVALGRAPDMPLPGSGRPFSILSHVFHSSLLGTVCPPELFLTIWLVHGFCAGCLCGLLFRNGVASGVFALVLAAALTAVWVPSMLEGGLLAWQVFGAPILLLLSTRLLLRPWAAGRIVSWTTAVRLTPFVVLALLWIAGGLWYRVLEIPYVQPQYDLNAYRASLPTPEQNQAGELVRGACVHFDDLCHELAPKGPPQPPAVQVTQKSSLEERAIQAGEFGWPADDPELGAWLDHLFAGDWATMLKEAADLPPGMVEDLRNEIVPNAEPTHWPARTIGVVLVARGLQRQAAGDDETYVENLRIGLALARSLRRHAVRMQADTGRDVGAVLIRGLDRWLEKLNGRPDLLHKALDLLSAYQDESAGDDAEQTLANYLVARNTLDYPFPWLLDYLSGAAGRYRDDAVREEARWVATAALVPWEHERQERMLRVLFEGTDAQRWSLFSRRGPFTFEPLAYPGPYNGRTQTNWQCRECAARLKLALRWYQAENGKPAETLDELVPKFLPAIPADPYREGGSFHYRLSRGEEIEWPTEAAATAVGLPSLTRKVSPGQGVLWSVGPDGKDDGGHKQAGTSQAANSVGEDLIFLVPLPPPQGR